MSLGAPAWQGDAVRSLTVVGLSGDGLSLVLQAGSETFRVPLAEVERARTPRPVAVPSRQEGTTPPSPREIQQRIRLGESAADIARAAGLPVEAVARFEGPPLAERQHQVRMAQRAEVDGRSVEQLVERHLTRKSPQHGVVVWDAWLTPAGHWEVHARAGREAVRLGWDALARRVEPLDETGRQVLGLAPAAEDALGAVLRPRPVRVPRDYPPVVQPELPEDPADEASSEVAEAAEAEPSPPAAPAPAARSGSPRRARAAVPAWDDIASQVSGRGPRRPGP